MNDQTHYDEGNSEGRSCGSCPHTFCKYKKYYDIVPRAEFTGDLLEAKNRRDDYLPNILPKHGRTLFPRDISGKRNSLSYSLCDDDEIVITNVANDKYLRGSVCSLQSERSGLLSR